MDTNAVVLACISLIGNGLMGLLTWTLRSMYVELKEKLKELDEEIRDTQKNYFRRDDFKEFKEELFDRLKTLEVKFDKATGKE